MGNYCKAYLVDDLSRYEKWAAIARMDAGAVSNDEPRYLFLQENYVVTDGIFLDEKIVFDDVTPEWRQFCEQQLGFEVPDMSATGAATN